MTRVLVAGIGNIFLGDDGFGSEVARHLAGAAVPEGVEISDFGIRGVHLAYQLLEGYDTLVLIDAVRRGDEPGTVSVIEPDLSGGPEADGLDPLQAPLLAVDAHGMDPETVLRTLSGIGGTIAQVLVVGCEPASIEEEMGLSETVARAVPIAADLVLRLVDEIMASPAGVGGRGHSVPEVRSASEAG